MSIRTRFASSLVHAAIAIAALQVSLGGQPEAPFFAGFKIYLGNLHAHTAFSDGSGFPDEAFEHAEDAGLDFMAITEHNHTNNIFPKDPQGGEIIGSDPALYDALIQAAGQQTQAGSFVALAGQEFSSIGPGNHINVFGASQVIPEDTVANGDYRAFYQDWLPAHLEVPFIQFNHPWEQLNQGIQNYGRHQFQGSFAQLRQASARVRTIEVMNGPGLNGNTGLPTIFKGEGAYKQFLSNGFRIGPSADQDNHRRTWGTLTDARTGVLAGELTASGIVDAILARRCYATSDSTLRVGFAVNDRIMGSEITATTRKLRIAYKIEDASEPSAKYDIHIVHGSFETGDAPKQKKLESVQGDREAEKEFTTSHDRAFVYLRVVQNPQTESARDFVLTSPVWVTVVP
jgi:hypothetical protein